MSENRHKNGSPARLGRLVGLLAFVSLGALIILALSSGAKVWATPGQTPFRDTIPGTAAGEWSVTGSMNTARSIHTMTLLPDGKVLVVGGMNDSGYLDSAEVYDPATGTWSTTGSMNIAHNSHTATLLGDGKVLVAGGYTGSHLSSAEVYDPATGTWSATGSMNTPRNSHTMTLLGDGRVLVTGGSDRSYGYLDSAEVYDPATGAWTATNSMSTAHKNHKAIRLSDGKVLVAGGKSSFDNWLNIAELYNPDTGTWSNTGSMNTARDYFAATLLPDGKVLVAGGWYNHGSFLSSAEVYDPDTGTWSNTGSMATTRSGPPAIILPDGRVLAAGHEAPSSCPSNAEVYDPATGTWAVTNSMNTACGGVTATLLPNGRVLVAGGYDGGYLSSAELFQIPAYLAISKSVTPSQTAPGQPITYTLTYTNIGLEPATGVVITDVVPITLTNVGYTSSGAAITPTGGVSYTWQVEDLDSDEGGVVTITGVVSPDLASDAIFTNTVTIAGVITGTSMHNSDSAVVTVSLPPVEINAGDEYAASTAVTLTLRAPFTADQMRLSHDGSAWNDWEDYAATRDWTLQAGDGTKAVYGQFYGGGETSDVYSDTIVLDTTPPTVTVEIAAGAYAVNTTTVTVTVAGSDATSGLDTLEWSDDGSVWGDAEPFVAGTHTRTLQEPSPYTVPDFGPRMTYASSLPIHVAVGDLDGDGNLDLVTANYHGNVSVLLNQGDGTFASKVEYGVGSAPYCVAVGDLDGDGDLDLATANYESDNASVLLNRGDGTFASQVTYGTGGRPSFVAMGDLDGDDDLDLVAANGGDSYISVLLNEGDGTFASQVTYSVGSGQRCVAVGDLDGDGDLDLATNNVWVLLNEGDGTFASPAHYDVGSSPRRVAVGDLDGDDDLDLVTANESSDDISVLLNEGDGTFASQVTYGVGDHPVCVAVGILDGDSDLDLVVANHEGNNVSVLLNQGNGTFGSPLDYGMGSRPLAVAVGDLDGDGDLDLATADYFGHSVSVRLNHLHLPPLDPATLYVRATDHVGWSTVFSDTVYVDTAAPSGCSLQIANGRKYTAQLNVELAPRAYDQLGADHIEMAFRNAGDSFGDWVAYSTTDTWTLPSGDGAKTVEAKYRDVAGNVSDVVSDTITLDQTPPTGSSVSINDGAATATQVTVTLTLAGSDALSGVSQMRFSADGSSWGAWETFAATHARVLDATDGLQAVYMQLRDTAGNVATAVSDTITVEVNPPLGEITINDGATWTNQVTVTLMLMASDAGSGVARMRLREAGGVWGSWIAYTAAYSFTLSGGDGTKTVEVQYEDGYGRQTDTLSDNIVLDTAAPSGSISVNDDATYATSTSVTLSLSGSDATSGVAQMCFSNDGSNWSDWESYGTTKSWTLTSGDGTETVYVKYKDNAGNVSTPYTDTITLDTTDPDGSISINDGATYATSTAVALTLSASDATSGVSQMRFSNDGTSYSDWEDYGTSKSCTLTSGDGTRTVYVRYKDNAGNTATYSDTIILDTTSPSSAVASLLTYQTSTSFAVSWSGSDALAGLASYDVQYRDGAGGPWVDWKMATMDTSATFTGSDGHTYYFQSRARDNAGNVETYPGGDGDTHTTVDVTAPDGAINIEGGATYANTTTVNLTLSASDATSGVSHKRFSNDGVSYSGWQSYATSASWTLSTGDGTKTVYVKYKDNAGNVSIPYTDTITLDTTDPTGSVSINAGASYAHTTSVTLTLSADDALSGVAQMRFSNDGTSYSGWENYTTSKSWTLSTGDGTKTVYVQYKDNAGNVGTYTDSIILDTGPPSSSVSDLPTYQSTLSFPVSWSGSDTASGIASYDVQVRDGVSWEDWQVNTVATSTDFVGTDGHTYYFQSRARDNAGNVEAYPGGDGDTHTTVDVTAPDGTVIIEGGATYVTDTSVSLTLSANDATSGAAQMRFSNDGSNWSTWESYGTSKAWTLASGEGTKTVYVEYKDNVGNVSTAQTDTIILDTTSPTVGLTAPDDEATVSGTAMVSAEASDANGIAQVRFYVADELLASDTSPPWGFDWDTTSYTDGAYVVKAVAYDNAGLLAASASRTANVDNVVGPTYVSGSIAHTVAWTAANSPYVVTGNVVIPADRTVTIEPGTQVRFDGLYNLQVGGDLQAVGTPDQMIVFTSNQASPAPGDWGRIEFTDPAVVSRLEYAHIEYGGSNGYYTAAVYVEGAGPTISNNVVVNNTSGLYLKNDDSTVTSNYIASCSGGYPHWGGSGIYVNSSRATIRYNSITGNKFGAVLDYANDDLTLDHNNFLDNTSYAVFNNCAHDWDARNNYWGTTNASLIDQYIFDHQDVYGLGTVSYVPFLTSGVENTPPTQPGQPTHQDSTAKSGYDDDTSLDFTWTASSDDVGVDHYNVYVSVDGGDYAATTTAASNSVAISGENGHTYRVKVQAEDEAGKVSAFSEASDAVACDTTSVPSGSVVINGGAAYATASGVTLGLSASDTASQIAQMRFSNDGASYDDWRAYSTSASWTLTSGDGEKTVYAQFMNGGGRTSDPYTDTIVLDTTSPTCSISINQGAAYATITTVTLTLSAADATSGVSQMRFSNDETSWSAWEAYGTSKSWTLASGDGQKTAYVQFRDGAGTVSSCSDAITLDTIPPDSAVDALSAYQTSTSFAVSWSGSDATSGLASYDVQYRDGAGFWADWLTETTETSATFTGQDGHAYYFQSRARDTLGNLETYPGGDGDTHTTVDATPPSGSVLINGGAIDTTSTAVTLGLSTDDAAQMRFSSDGTSYSGWEDYATSKSWTLASGDGTKTAHAQFKDDAGNTAVFSDSINLDTSLATDYRLSINEGALFTNQTAVTLTLSASPHTSQVIVSNEGGFDGAEWEPYVGHKQWTISEYGSYVIPRIVYAKFKDVAGTVSSLYQDDIILDVNAPLGGFQIEEGGAGLATALRLTAGLSSSWTFTVTLNFWASDDVSGVEDMLVSNDAEFEGAAWETFATSKEWGVPNGVTTVHVKYRDRAGNVSQVYTDSTEQCPLYTDFDCNCVVGVTDIMKVASRWLTSCDNPDPDDNPDTPNYEARYDLDHDCDIDITDIMEVAVRWSDTCASLP